MRLTIVRHGQTEENVAGIIQGHLPGKLTDRGKEQAEKVAERLKEEHFDIIYSSDLARAADTAKAIARYHTNTELILTERLREKDHGDLQGKKSSKGKWQDRLKQYKDPIKDNPHGGESWLDLFNRAESFVHDMLHKHREQGVLFVAHGGVIRAMLCVIREQKPEVLFEVENVGNTSVSTFGVYKIKNTSVESFNIDEDKNHHIHCLNCTKHLD